MDLSSTDVRDAFFDQVYELGKKDKDFIFISDDMDAFGLRKFKKDLPKQFINIRVAEQNMIDLSAGLASCGKKVVCFGICSYVTTRCLEQIRFSICSMNLPVTIVGIGAGFSFNFDGPTHQGTHDVGVMRMLSGLTIFNPSDALSASESLNIAYKKGTPNYIRLDKGTFPSIYNKIVDTQKGFKIIFPLKKINIISTGFMTSQLMNLLTANNLEKKIGLIDLFQIKPVPKNLLNEVLKKSKKIITVEEHSYLGGIGTIISELILTNNINSKLKVIALKDEQCDKFGSREYLQSLNNIDSKSLTLRIKNELQKI